MTISRTSTGDTARLAMAERAKAAYLKAFGEPVPGSGAAGVGVVRAPGRVELLGGHTDYNEGFVLPMAVRYATYIAFAPAKNGNGANGNGNGTRKVRVWADALNQMGDFETGSGVRPTAGQTRWLNYIKGVATGLMDRGIEVPALNMAVVTDLPMGAGLSSSAALEVGSALAFLHAAGREIPPPEIAKICQAAEHNFAGTPCGIMDQFISLLGRQGHALLLDCRTLEHQLVPVDDEDYEFLIADTGVKHNLGDSEYPKRRKQCEEAVRLLARYDPSIKSLRDVSPELVNDHFAQMPREVAARARHVVTENLRVLHAALHLRNGRMAAFGKLLLESHASLRDNFEVSCKESDALVRIATSVSGVLGARMTGGGFGGAVIILVNRAEIDRLGAALETEYFREFGRKVALYRSAPAAGASVLEECARP